MKENNKTITKNQELAKTFKNLFCSIAPKIGIENSSGDLAQKMNYVSLVLNAIKKYKYNPSIKKIKYEMSNKGLSFPFNYLIKKKIVSVIPKLDNKKSCQGSDIPVKRFKDSINVVSDFFKNSFNNPLFPFQLEFKNVKIPPFFLKRPILR